MLVRSAAFALCAVICLGGCAASNTNLPGSYYFAFGAVDGRQDQVLAEAARTGEPEEEKGSNWASYRGETIGRRANDRLRTSRVTWELVHGLRVGAEQEERFLGRLAESIRDALTECLPSLGSFESAQSVPQDLARQPGRIEIGGVPYVQYPVTVVDWETRPASVVGKAGRTFRVRSVELVAYGTQMRVDRGDSVAVGLELEFGGDAGGNSVFESRSAVVDVASATGRCNAGGVDLAGPRQSLGGGEGLRMVGPGFTLEATLTLGTQAGTRGDGVGQ